MSDRAGVSMGVEKGLKILPPQVVLLGHPVDEGVLVFRSGPAVKFGPVAGGENCRFFHVWQLYQAGKRMPEPLCGDCQAFP